MNEEQRKNLSKMFFDKFTEVHDGGADAGEFCSWIQKDPNRVWSWIEDKIAEAERRAVKQCLKVAEGMKMIGSSPIGALHGAGWNDAVGHIVEDIKKLTELGKEGK